MRLFVKFKKITISLILSDFTDKKNQKISQANFKQKTLSSNDRFLIVRHVVNFQPNTNQQQQFFQNLT